MITIHSLLLQGLNIQTDTSGNIYGFINKDRIIEELQGMPTDKNGVIMFRCELRRKAAANGKAYTHMQPSVDVKTQVTHPSTSQDGPLHSDFQ